MNYYQKITLWENNNRIAKLIKFRGHVIDYFNGITTDYLDIIDINPDAKKARSEINLMSADISRIIQASGIDPVYIYYPPPAVGGYVKNVDLIDNIFLLHKLDCEPNLLVDILERSLGIYYSNNRASIIRTFNPLFWLELVLNMIASVPFRLLSNAGFSTVKFENSFIGKFISLLIQIITVVATVLTILQILGYSFIIDNVRKSIDYYL